MSETNAAETSKPKPLRLAMPSNGMAQWPTINRVLKLLVSKLGFRLEIDGAESAEQTGDGLRFKLNPGEITGDHPFKGVPDGDDLLCLGGFVNDIELADLPVDLSSVPAGYVYVEAIFTLEIEDSYLYQATLTGASIGAFTELPESDIATGVFYINLFRFDGQNVVQNARRDLRIIACDNGDGSAYAQLSVLQI